MIPAAVIAAMVNCSEPRMSYHAFFERNYGPYPGMQGEPMSVVNDRIAYAASSFFEYVAAYSEKCMVRR